MANNESSSLAMRFIPTRHPSWQEFASRTGGELVRNRFWKGSDQVVSRMGGWEVHLSSVMLDPKTGDRNPATFYSTHRGTEVWAGFESTDGFRFLARDRGWSHRRPGILSWDMDLSRLADAVRRRFRPEDTEIGHEGFDERFVTRTDNPVKLRALLDGPVMARVLGRPNLAEIYIDGPEPEEGGSSQPASLVLWERSLLQDVEALLDLHEVLLALLDRLSRTGSAVPLSSTPR